MSNVPKNMLQFGRHFYNTISNIMSGTEQSKEPEVQLPFNMQYHDSDRYQPSLEDVLTVKNILYTLRPDSPLPLELIDTILDLSEYWPHTTTAFPLSSHQEPTINREIIVRAGGAGEDRLILRSLPIGCIKGNNDQAFQMPSENQTQYFTQERKPWPKDREIPQNATEEVLKKWAETSQIRGGFPCKKIVFRIKSHDQGWGGVRADKGTYRGSYTWFDVGLERTYAAREAKPFYNDPEFRLPNTGEQASGSMNEIICALQTIIPDVQNNPNYNPENTTNPRAQNPLMFKHGLNPDNTYLQKNKTATSASQEHTIVWRFNDDIHPESPEADDLEAQGRGRESANGDFVRNLKTGDVVTVWAKARYPGWANTVEEVSIDVYWAI
ncbi:hypothetical protein SBOR_3090 [Sclerotinia borealis F-4128]|uniref:Uncharacterized protein n=1 Tax=Sclerotinia borealis (strain F-4128) TaxID=1432307 RepID=W9CKQ7_SCLBF|nr:hypothetical protein SBOR_3090 [Sclerotinia borealis F-4128]